MDAEYIAALERLIVGHLNQSIWQLRKSFERFVEVNGPCDAIPTTGLKKDLDHRLQVLRSWTAAAEMQKFELEQLLEGSFPIWVYLGGDECPCPEHSALHGIVLPSTHPFWLSYFPPNGWGCRCRVRGTRNEAGARRLRGDPDKALPAWVGSSSNVLWVFTAADAGFHGRRAPGMAARLAALPSYAEK